jgi:hypothetical protein
MRNGGMPEFLLFDTLNKFKENNKNNILNMSEVDAFYHFYFEDELGVRESKRIYDLIEFNKDKERLFFSFSKMTGTNSDDFYLKGREPGDFRLFDKYFSLNYSVHTNHTFLPLCDLAGFQNSNPPQTVEAYSDSESDSDDE